MKAQLTITAAALAVAAHLGAASAGDTKKEAKDLYQQGLTDFAAGRYEEASTAFRQAYKLKPSWKIRYNIGQSEAAAKRYGSALDAFETYLAEGGDEVETARRDEVLAEIERLRLLVGFIDVKGPDGAHVVVDGLDRGQLPLGGRIRETAGVDHEVAVLAAGGDVLLSRSGVRLGSGEILTIDVSSAPTQPAGEKAVSAEQQPASAAEPSTGETTTEQEGMRPLRLAGWVALGVGAVVAIAGGVTGGLALSKQGELEDACPDKACTNQGDMDIRDSVDALSLTTDILIPVGAAVAVAGAVMLIVDYTRGKETATAGLRPWIGGDGAGLVLEGRF